MPDRPALSHKSKLDIFAILKQLPGSTFTSRATISPLSHSRLFQIDAWRGDEPRTRFDRNSFAGKVNDIADAHPTSIVPPSPRHINAMTLIQPRDEQSSRRKQNSRDSPLSIIIPRPHQPIAGPAADPHSHRDMPANRRNAAPTNRRDNRNRLPRVVDEGGRNDARTIRQSVE